MQGCPKLCLQEQRVTNVRRTGLQNSRLGRGGHIQRSSGSGCGRTAQLHVARLQREHPLRKGRRPAKRVKSRVSSRGMHVQLVGPSKPGSL